MPWILQLTLFPLAFIKYLANLNFVFPTILLCPLLVWFFLRAAPDGSRLWAITSYFMIVIKSCTNVLVFLPPYRKSRAHDPVITLWKTWCERHVCMSDFISTFTSVSPSACARYREFSTRPMYLWNAPYKPFEEFASHPLYSISGGKLSQWTKKCCRKWALWRKKNEELQVSQSHRIRSGRRLHSFPQVLRIRVGNIQFQTHMRDRCHVWKCMHTEVNTYNKAVALPLQPS